MSLFGSWQSKERAAAAVCGQQGFAFRVQSGQAIAVVCYTLGAEHIHMSKNHQLPRAVSWEHTQPTLAISVGSPVGRAGPHTPNPARAGKFCLLQQRISMTCSLLQTQDGSGPMLQKWTVLNIRALQESMRSPLSLPERWSSYVTQRRQRGH